MQFKCTAVLLSWLVVSLVAGCGIIGGDERLIIPEGHRGFVGVFHERGSATLPKRDGWITIEFPSDGIIFTSSRLDTRWKKIEFFERKGDRLAPMRSNLVGPIPGDVPPEERIVTGGTTHTIGNGPPVVIYFVGDAQDRAKINWQSSTQWIQEVLRTRK